jgi:fructokinase
MSAVLCFGELLWDELPAGARLGGAPANVAYHLARLGLPVRLVSAVGCDAAGEEALRRLAEAGVDVELVARRPQLPTGRVRVKLDAAGGPRYRIEEGVAWDSIPFTLALSAAAAAAAALVFGTLAQRTAANRSTLAALIAAAPGALKLCDLNFRSPFVAAAAVAESLRAADVLKLNAEELAALPALLGLPGGTELVPRLLADFRLKRIVLTRGESGCRILMAGRQYDAAPPPTRVVDSVGAGDAFTAMLVFGELAGWPPARGARAACALGAFVAGGSGAMPAWPPGLRERLLAD